MPLPARATARRHLGGSPTPPTRGQVRRSVPPDAGGILADL